MQFLMPTKQKIICFIILLVFGFCLSFGSAVFKDLRNNVSVKQALTPAEQTALKSHFSAQADLLLRSFEDSGIGREAVERFYKLQVRYVIAENAFFVLLTYVFSCVLVLFTAASKHNN